MVKQYTINDFHQGEMVTVRDVDALGLTDGNQVVSWEFNDKKQTAGLIGTVTNISKYDGTIQVFIKTPATTYHHWYVPNWLRPVGVVDELDEPTATTREADNELFW